MLKKLVDTNIFIDRFKSPELFSTVYTQNRSDFVAIRDLFEFKLELV